MTIVFRALLSQDAAQCVYNAGLENRRVSLQPETTETLSPQDGNRTETLTG